MGVGMMCDGVLWYNLKVFFSLVGKVFCVLLDISCVLYIFGVVYWWCVLMFCFWDIDEFVLLIF